MKTIFTKPDGKTVTIEWTVTDDLIDDHGHEKHYAATGIDEHNTGYVGTCIVTDGTFEEIDNDSIEEK